MKTTILIITFLVSLTSHALDLFTLDKYEGVVFHNIFCGPTSEFDNPNFCYSNGASQVQSATQKAVWKGFFSCGIENEVTQFDYPVSLVGTSSYDRYSFLYIPNQLGRSLFDKGLTSEPVTIYVDKYSIIRAIEKKGEFLLIDTQARSETPISLN